MNTTALRNYFFFLFILINSLSVVAQPGGQYLFSHLGRNDGLVSNEVYAIQQDERGYIWLGTNAGLQRYDGQRFLTFRHKSNVPGSIPEGTIHGLQLDNRNRLWILFAGFKVGYLNTTDLTYHDVPIRAAPDILVRSKGGIYIDNHGNVLLVVIGYGILTFDESLQTFTTEQKLFKLPTKWDANFIWQDKSQNYWIGCDSGLVKYNTQRQSLSYGGHNADNDPVIASMADLKMVIYAYIDKSKRFWITSWLNTAGLKIKSYNPLTNELKEWQDIIGRSIQGRYYELAGITELQDGTLWFGGHNIFAKLNGTSNGVDPILANLPGEFSIRFDDIHQVFEDREKNIWVGTDKGLFRFNPSAQLFKGISLQRFGNDSIYTPDVTDILQTSNGTILISTWGNGIFAFDKNFVPVPSLPSNHSTIAREGMAWCMHERSNGDVWRADQGGIIYIYHKNTNTAERLQPEVFEKSTIRQVTEDKKGNLWFSTQRGYLIKWDQAMKNFTLIRKLGSITTRLYTDSFGKIWVATEVNGVFRVDPDNGSIIAQYTMNATEGKRLRANHATDIIQYSDSVFMIAANGLNILNTSTNSILFFTEDQGLLSNTILNLTKDGHGYVWMATAAGVVSYHPAKGKLSSYIYTDGVHTTSFSVGSAATLSDGRIAFGTAHDVLIFDPKQVTIIEYLPPKIEISGIAVMNQPLSVDSLLKKKTIELEYRENSITFDLSTLTFQNLYPVYYMMEDVDKNWIQANNSNQAIYTYLPPGTYTFKAASMDAEGKIGKVTSIKLHVKAPFWKTWWFYSLVALAFSGVLFAFDRQRMQRMKREQEIRSAIAANLHEDVSTGLQNINVLSEIAGLKAEKQPEQSRDFIHQIQQKSRSMVIAMSDVLWSVDPHNDSMPKTIERLHEVAHAMRNRHAITVEVQADKKVLGLHLSMNVRHELIMIYKLILVNLVEELQSPQTIVQLDYTRPILHLRILSIGVTLPKTPGTVTKNMSEIRKRAAAIDGELHVQTDDKSTEIVLGIRV